MSRKSKSANRWCSVLAAILGLASGYGTSTESSVLVTLAPAQPADMRTTLTAYGTVEFAPDQLQALSVQGEGLVTHVHVAPGQRVRKGDALVELTATANSATELEHARIAVEFATKDLERLQDLRTRQLATNAEVRTAEENRVKAESALANVRKRLGETSHRCLRADLDGYVEAVHVHAGDIVSPGALLLLLAPADKLRVRLGIEPEDLPIVQEGQKVVIKPLHPGLPPKEGQVNHIYYQVDPKTRLAEAVVLLTGSSDWLPGITVKAELVVAEHRQVVTVPYQAVLSRDGRHYLFVDEQGHARQRWVEIGFDDGQRVEI
ncbi:MULTISPECIES: efflux RND transporter periplasmic adaptor subunit [Methylococcus]|uniref:Efflux RND transporter periplasmic adaptor subunit n=1 Tax=Methylococcus capsulatus TaxID=414 RepID=A0ABZ2F527_METCP|nr:MULTISPECIES: efflux RND transporter periplasmic adaptor subunit [Methylococcus]